MRFHLAVAVLTASLCLLTHLIEAAEYKYPYKDPYLATATTAILGDDGATTRVKSQTVHLPGLAGRNRLPSLEGRGNLSMSLYRQSGPAPLIFIVAGVGSTPYFGIGPSCRQPLLRRGFPYRHPALADELELCISCKPERRSGLRSRRCPRSI